MDSSTWTRKQYQLCVRQARHCQQPPTWPLRTPALGRGGGPSASTSLLTPAPLPLPLRWPSLLPTQRGYERPLGILQRAWCLEALPRGAGPAQAMEYPPLLSQAPGPPQQLSFLTHSCLKPPAPVPQRLTLLLTGEEPGFHCRVYHHPPHPPRGQSIPQCGCGWQQPGQPVVATGTRGLGLERPPCWAAGPERFTEK